MRFLVSFSYHYGESHVCPETDRDFVILVKEAEKWADLWAIVDLPDGYHGHVNLTKASDDPNDWNKEKSDGDIIIDV